MNKLEIIYTTDVHTYFFPTNLVTKDRSDIGLFSLGEKKESNKLFLDCGDIIQGNSLSDFLRKSENSFVKLAEMMNDLNYDCVTLGNHEFNFGYDLLKTYVNNLNAHVVSANIIDLTGELNIKKHVIITLDNGLKVGITGACTPYVKIWEQKKNLENFDILPVIPSLRYSYEYIKQNSDITILLYHGGFEKNQLEEEGENENIANLICNTYEFDMVLTGHQHQALESCVVNKSFTTQNTCNATTYEKIVVDEKMNISSTKEKISCKNLDKGLLSKYESILNNLNEYLDEVVGYLDNDITETNQLSLMVNGSEFANIINNIILEETKADITCTSLMNNVFPLNKEVSIRDLLVNYPFSNTITLLELTKDDLLKSLENVATFFEIDNEELVISKKYLEPKLELFNFDFFTGITYEFDISKPIGNRVTKLLFNDKEINSETKFKVAVNNYRASGVGGYDHLRNCKVINSTQMDIQELLINYFIKNKYVNFTNIKNYKVII